MQCQERGIWTTNVRAQFLNWRRGKNRFLFAKRLAAILPYIPEGSSVLDVGCGDMEMLEKIREAKDIGFYAGIDLVDNSRGFILGRTILGDAQDLPIKDERFSCIVSTAVIEHLFDPERGLDEFRRVLKKGGRAIITTPNPMFSPLAYMLSVLGLKYAEGLERKITLKWLGEMLSAGGFRVIATGHFLVRANQLIVAEKE